MRSSRMRMVVVLPAPFGPEIAKDFSAMNLEIDSGDADPAPIVF